MNQKTLDRYAIVSAYIHNQTEEEWTKLVDAILGSVPSINVPFSENDIQELENGEVFDWTFGGVKMHIFRADYTCADCGEEIENGEEHEHEDDYYCINCVPV